MRVPNVLDTKDGDHTKLVFDKNKNLQFAYHTMDEYMYTMICDGVMFVLLIAIL